MDIQLAVEDDAASLSSLILKTASYQLRNEFTDDGWVLFQKILTVETQTALIKSRKFKYLIAIDDSSSNHPRSIIGLLAIKAGNHLFHFFVEPDWQGKGVGKQLWQRCLEDLSDNKEITQITVNSSDFGLPFYHNIGFVMDAGRQKKNGICYTPMTFAL